MGRFLLQNIKKWTLQKMSKNTPWYSKAKRWQKWIQRRTIMELNNVILCFWSSVIVFRIYDWKKLQTCLTFYVFFSNFSFSKCYFKLLPRYLTCYGKFVSLILYYYTLIVLNQKIISLSVIVLQKFLPVYMSTKRSFSLTTCCYGKKIHLDLTIFHLYISSWYFLR